MFFYYEEEKPKVGRIDHKKEIIKIISSMSGSRSEYEIFSDWIRCMAIAIENSTHVFRNEIWKEREKLYKDTMNRYTLEERQKFPEMLAHLTLAFEEGLDDILGKVYMEFGMGSRVTGQFFTPFNVSEMVARLSLETIIEQYEKGELEKITVLEPSCGAGGMIIAAAKVLQQRGINYQQAMDVVAQDLDWKGVYMCYVQLSLLGISAICVQGDTLSDPYVPGKTEQSHILQTPKKAGMLI